MVPWPPGYTYGSQAKLGEHVAQHVEAHCRKPCAECLLYFTQLSCFFQAVNIF